MATPPAKAAIVLLKGGLPYGRPISCHFNPTEYSVARSVSWNFTPMPGVDQPVANYQGGGNSTMSLTLLFDTLTDLNGIDVRLITNPLWEAAEVNQTTLNNVTQKGEPAHIMFTWGTMWSFEAVVTNISQNYTLFKENGTPVRATVTLALTQIKHPNSFPRQNPTSGGTPGEIYVVREGDRLDLIAQEHYKRPILWRYIAEHNDIDNPRQLVPGQRLVIPPLP